MTLGMELLERLRKLVAELLDRPIRDRPAHCAVGTSLPRLPLLLEQAPETQRRSSESQSRRVVGAEAPARSPRAPSDDPLSREGDIGLSSAEEKHKPGAHQPERPGDVGERDDRARKFPALLLEPADELERAGDEEEADRDTRPGEPRLERG